MTIEYADPNCLKDFPYSLKLFPPLNGEAFRLLKEDIKEHGIRTPLEITKEMVVLKGHERKRVALALELKEVPVIYTNSKEIIDQKIACIKDNLARKNVDFRTKLRCYKELKTLYGLKERENMEKYPRDTKGRINKPVTSVEGTVKMSQDEIAKEVGFDAEYLRRASVIEDSDLPDKLKAAAFDGRLGIRPIAELAEQEPEIKEIVVRDALKRLENGEVNFSVETMARETKEKMTMAEALEQAGIPNVPDQIKQFYERISPPTTAPNPVTEKISRKDITDTIINIIEKNHIQCPTCGETHIAWRCGHDFSE